MRMWAVPNINQLLFEMQLEKEFRIQCFDISAKEQFIALGGENEKNLSIWERKEGKKE